MKKIIITTRQLRKLNEANESDITVKVQAPQQNSSSYAQELKKGSTIKDLNNAKRYATDVNASIEGPNTTDASPVIDKDISNGENLEFTPPEQKAIADGSPVNVHGKGFGNVQEVKKSELSPDSPYMTADEIFEDVKNNLFELRNFGEMEIIFGYYIGNSFRAYLMKDAVVVEYLGDKKEVKLEQKYWKNDNLLARSIMSGFAQLYLKKDVSEGKRFTKRQIEEARLRKIRKEGVVTTKKRLFEEVMSELSDEDDYASTGDPYNLIDEPMDEPSMDGYYAFSNIYVDIKGDGTDNPCIEIFSRRYGDRKKICGQQAASILKNIENDIEDCGGFYQAIYKNTCRYVS